MNRPGIVGGSNSGEVGVMTNRRQRYSPEFRERAIRLVQEHKQTHGSETEAIRSIAEKLGCSREANEILRRAASFFGAELDRRPR